MPIKMDMQSAVKIPHCCIVKLQAIYDSLKTAEKKAADLLLEKPEFFSRASIIEAANAAGCSEATLSRLARKLGFKGYPELKECLCSKEASGAGAYQLYNGISGEEGHGQIIQKVFNASIQALQDTLSVIDVNEYAKAVDSLCGAGKIVMIGTGDAAAVARSGCQKFMRLGLSVQAPEDVDLQLLAVSHLGRGDVLVAVSHSGRTKSVIENVKLANRRGATVISITNYPLSPLAKNSDIVLLTAAFAEHRDGEIMSKRIAELCILESLYISTLLNHKGNLADTLSDSNIILEVNKL